MSEMDEMIELTESERRRGEDGSASVDKFSEIDWTLEIMDVKERSSTDRIYLHHFKLFGISQVATDWRVIENVVLYVDVAPIYQTFLSVLQQILHRFDK